MSKIRPSRGLSWIDVEQGGTPPPTRGFVLFDDIEILLVLSKAKSLSQAAGQLYMSRPGLSQ